MIKIINLLNIYLNLIYIILICLFLNGENIKKTIQ